MSVVHPDLIRRDARAIPDDPQEIRLFTVVRDEMLRLPYFLTYYRQLGVQRFFVISNSSGDGTDEFLLAQPDVCLFTTTASYAATRMGLGWINPLITQYGSNRWILCTDADELLVFPHASRKTLRELITWLDENDYQGMSALMLDMYARGPVKDVNYRPGEPFLDACSYFDRDYTYVRRLGVPGILPACPPSEPIGGPRLRLCFPDQNTAALWPRLKIKLMRRWLRVAHKRGWLMDKKPPTPATQAFKIPLVKWQQGYGYINSHRLNPIRLARLTGALLHFKYFQDFSARIQAAIDLNNHFDGSIEYKRYAELMKANPNLSMAYEGSTAYNGAGDLVKLGLIADDPQWRAQ